MVVKGEIIDVRRRNRSTDVKVEVTAPKATPQRVREGRARLKALVSVGVAETASAVLDALSDREVERRTNVKRHTRTDDGSGLSTVWEITVSVATSD